MPKRLNDLYPMVKKTKIAVTPIAVAITCLMIIAYHTEPKISPSVPQIPPVSKVMDMSKACAIPTGTEPIVVDELT